MSIANLNYLEIVSDQTKIAAKTAVFEDSEIVYRMNIKILNIISVKECSCLKKIYTWDLNTMYMNIYTLFQHVVLNHCIN